MKMKKIIRMVFATMLVLFITVPAWASSAIAADSLVPDQALRYAINEALGYTGDDIQAHDPTQAELEGLTVLSYDGNAFGQVHSLEGLQYSTNLDNLSINNSDLQDLSPIAQLPKITHLYLDNDNITDISQLASLTTLQELELTNNQIQDISPVQNMQQLTNLDLINNNIEDITVLTDLDAIHAVYLENNHVYDVSAVAGKTVGTIYVEQQSITMPIQTVTEGKVDLTVPNKIRGINNYIEPVNISNDGTYDSVSNEISWTDIPAGTENTSYTFNYTEFEGEEAFYFSGTVLQPLDWIYNVQPIIAASDKTIHVEQNPDLRANVTATDEEDGDLTNQIVITGSVDNQTVGVYPITYSVTDSQGGTATITVNVTVINDPPAIFATDQTIHVGDKVDVLKNVTATDTEDGDLTNQITYTGTVDNTKPGDYPITYSVADAQGQTTTKNVTIHVINDSPVINNPSSVTLHVGDTFNPLDYATAKDYEDGNLTDKLVVENNTVDTALAGDYTVTYSVTDSVGAKTESTMAVKVIADSPNVIPSDNDDDNNNNQTPQILPPATADTVVTPQETNQTLPQTGDQAVGSSMLLLGLALVGYGALYLRKK
ncbi:immunoglobulin-like domain-containing protein [Listeria costaricensis]|uniref:immunoglobulin-like domain-containing protein n=1 Tax=Listeria costaricensis TaxID=2026604 RepID=UPI000C084F93|nr:immunoglobulin-like domain-containing protein [Listeria costaricensis]